MTRRLILLLVLWLAALPALAAVNARLERSVVTEGESFRVSFESDDSDADKPDFSPLATDFELLGTTRASNFSFVNGRGTTLKTWTVEMLAKRTGSLTIPAVVIGNELTQPLTIRVVPRGSDEAERTALAELEVEVDNESPWVQQQTVLTIRLISRTPITNASLSEPEFGGASVLVERMGDDRSYEEVRNGASVRIIERRYALFPQESGPLTMEPLRLEGLVPGRRNPTRMTMDPFANSRRLRVLSRALTLDVKPIPASYSGAVWLPASQLLLVETGQPAADSYVESEPFTRSLTLRAQGLSATQLPEISPVAPADFRQYPDQPKLESRADNAGVTGIRQEQLALIPIRSGQLELPAIEVDWFNTRTGKQETARLPARTLQVAPGSAAPAIPADDIPAVSVEAAAEETSSEESTAPGYWPWLTGLILFGWILSVLWLWPGRKATPNKPAGKPTLRQARKAVESACSAGDPAGTRDALINWARLQWPGAAINSLGDVATRADENLRQELHRLSRQLYSRNGEGWDATRLLEAFRAPENRTPKKKSGSAPALSPLHPDPGS